METEMESMDKQRRRAGNAVIAVAIVLMSIVATCAISSKAQADSDVRSLAPQVWQSIRHGSDISDALSAVGLSSVACGDVPAWFADEVLTPRDGCDVWANGDWSVVGISAGLNELDLRSSVEDGLEGNGWRLCPTGIDGAATYMKDEGACIWIAVQFSKTEDSAEAVLRILQG